MTTITLTFWSGFWTTIGGIAGFIVACVVLGLVVLYSYAYIFIYRNYPKMQIYRGENLVKNTYAPIKGDFRKCLTKMREGEKLVITLRNPVIDHSIVDLLNNHECKLDREGHSKLVGFEYNSDIYLTICESYSEQACVKHKLAYYFESTSPSDHLSNEEYEKLKQKEWWKLEKHRDMDTFYMVCTITRGTLPDDN